MNGNRLVAPSIIISLAAIIAVVILTITFKNIKSENQSINATGSAKQIIISDLGVLHGTISVNAPSAKEAYQLLQSEKPVLINYLTKQGFPEKEIEFQTLNSYANYMYNQNGQQIGISHYTASQMIRVSSPD